VRSDVGAFRKSWDLSRLVRYYYSLSLRGTCGLEDPPLALIALHFQHQLTVFLWKNQRSWNEVKVALAMEGLHPAQSLDQEVLPRQLETFREMVYLLMLLESLVNV